MYVCYTDYDTDAQYRPQAAIGGDAAGVGNATSGSVTDKLTREHRMTLEEAHMILNVNKGEAMEKVLEVCATALVLPPVAHRTLPTC